MCCDVQRHSRGSTSPTVALRFRVEDRIECQQSHRVKYNYRDDYELALPIPLDAATNKGLFALCTNVHFVCKSSAGILCSSCVFWKLFVWFYIIMQSNLLVIVSHK